MEKRTLTLKDSAIILLIAFLVSQLLVIVGELIVSAVLATIDYTQSQINNFFNTALGYLITSLFQFLAFVIIFVYYYKKTTLKQDCFTKKLNAWQALFFIGIGIITSFALTHYINYYCLTLNLFNKPLSLFPYELNSVGSFLISLISLAVIPAIGEELIFRGLIFNGLKQKGSLFAVVISSLFFTLFHFNLSQLFYPFMFGLLLGFVYSKTKNLIVPMLIHLVNNALNINIQYFSGSSIFKPSTLNLIFMIAGIIVYIAIIAYLFVVNYKQETQSEDRITKKEKTNPLNNLFTKDSLVFWAPIVFMVFLYIILV